MMSIDELTMILEAALLAAGEPVSLERLSRLFDEDTRPTNDVLKEALAALGDACATRSLELKEIASGWVLQVRSTFSPFIARLWEERPARYSRALLETLALIAYRQPITRAEIEDIRGVAVSSQIMKTLHDREWIRIVGHREVPGRPGLYATTRQFLDHFNLKTLSELPDLSELTDVDELAIQLEASTRVAQQPVVSQDAPVEEANISVQVPCYDESELEPA